MKTHTIISRREILLLTGSLILLAGCAPSIQTRKETPQGSVPQTHSGGSASIPHVPEEQYEPNFAGLTFRLEEDREDTRYPIPVDWTTQVDLRSSLRILFDPSQGWGQTAPPSPPWEGVEQLLTLTDEVAKEYESLTREKVDLRDPNAVKAFQKRVTNQWDKAIDLYKKAAPIAEKFGLSEPQFVKMLIAKEPGREGPPPVYENLAKFLREQIESLRKNANEFRQEKNKGGYEVTVLALHYPAIGEVSRLHVENYDNLPSGDPRPPDPLERYGIRMTPEDLRRFNMEVKMSRVAAEKIREIGAEAAGIRSNTQSKFIALKNGLRGMLDELTPDKFDPNVLREGLEKIVRGLQKIENTTSVDEKVKTASKQIRESLQSTQSDISKLAGIIQKTSDVWDQLADGKSGDVFELVAGQKGIFDTANQVVAGMHEFRDSVKKQWPQHIKTIEDHLPTVMTHLADEVTASAIKTVLAGFDDYLKELQPALALAVGAPNLVSSVAGAAEPVVSGSEPLANTQDSVWHDIKNPPTATIALRDYSKLSTKDRVLVKVLFRAKESSGLDDVEYTKSYHLEIEKLDLHASLTASLIFARASSGNEDATRWKSNVAAMVNWHYRHRHPKNTFEGIWNWLNPGAGVHLASLDQTDDTAEFGLGPNVTFWNGLIHAGFGWNLSRQDDREYFFVGISLLHLLDIARTAGQEVTWEREIQTR